MPAFGGLTCYYSLELNQVSTVQASLAVTGQISEVVIANGHWTHREQLKLKDKLDEKAEWVILAPLPPFQVGLPKLRRFGRLSCLISGGVSKPRQTSAKGATEVVPANSRTGNLDLLWGSPCASA